MAKESGFFIFLDKTVFGYAGGYAWVETNALYHHRTATKFITAHKPGTADFLGELKKFFKGTFGVVGDDILKKLTFEEADKYYKEKEEEATSPWALAGGMIRAGAKRVLLYGPPGVGKSMTPWKIAQELKAEFHSVTLTDMTPMAELRGHFVIRGMDTVWHDGILARAWRDSNKKRTIMVLNEIDHVGADAESFLHNFLDDPEMARIYLPNGECLTPGNIQVVATMNGIPDDLADALRDRFTVQVEITEPHPDALKALPESLREFAKRMILNPPKGQQKMSLRGFNDFVTLIKGADPNTGGYTQAARAMFGALGDDVLQALKVATAK
jgi:hypothetical protein